MLRSPDDPAAKHIRARPINTQTSSEDSFKQAQGWLGECLNSHDDCRLGADDTNFKPTRVIEIVESDPSWHVRLFRPSTAIDYVALSYCWGGPQTMLTTKTEKDWENSLPWAELSQTIKDSILVTSKLGYKYIWIDALCIMQDDTKDKMGEIAKMAQVYGSAIWTLAASKASAATEGFLEDRKVTEYPDHVFRLRVRCEDGQMGSAILFRPTTSNPLFSEPLNGRGWTLQERYLSSRILEYKRLQLKWTCTTVFLNPEKVSEYLDGWFDDVEDTVALADPDDDAPAIWRKMVYAYTLRSLTVNTDRILAISGVAEVLGRSIEGGYWAGLWESDLPLGLMWKSTPADVEYSKTNSGTLRSRPEEYQGPSWSWVSINSIANYAQYSTSEVTFSLQILGCDFELVDARAVYGSVKTAQLHVRGRIRPGVLHFSHNVASVNKSWWTLDADLEEGRAYATGDALEREFVTSPPSGIHVALLEVIRRSDMINEKAGDIISEGLILRKIGTQRYARLGTFSFYKDVDAEARSDQHSWFKAYEEDLFLE